MLLCVPNISQSPFLAELPPIGGSHQLSDMPLAFCKLLVSIEGGLDDKISGDQVFYSSPMEL